MICTERMATQGPVTAMVSAMATAAQPTLKWRRRLRTEINSDCVRNRKYHAAMASPWIRSRWTMAGSMIRPPAALPLVTNEWKPTSIITIKPAPAVL